MPHQNAHTFQPQDLEVQEMYKLMIGSVVPRPIAWVSSKSKEGVYNLAPFSFFTVASRQPPVLLVSIGPGVAEREGTTKDTLLNIEAQEEYVIQVVPEALGNQMHESSKHVDPEVDEFNLAGLKTVKAKEVDIPIVEASPIAFECKLNQIIPVGSDHLVLGEVVSVHIDDEAYAGNYRTAIDEWKPLARLAGDYASLSPAFKLPKDQE
ncbi:flavin reductase family protein [Salsuginibacillus kocurii]|uniref:flavin reductase family protein n=1 Tax=Salsuginibacillus kocurii TaxID=427078 RepID=UPI00035C9421|nr:flavin reductase family protein [Salsuginibacillus kocurii]